MGAEQGGQNKAKSTMTYNLELITTATTFPISGRLQQLGLGHT